MLPFVGTLPDQAVLREKVYAAERRMALIRIAIIALNSATYFTVFDRHASVGWLAVTIIAVAWAYALPVALFEPYRRMSFLAGSLFTAVSDAILISLWIVSTGGYSSPYYLLWYAAVASIAFRYEYRGTMIAASVYTVLYTALVAGMGQLTANPAGLLLRDGYIMILAALSGEAAREAYQQLRTQLQLRDRVRIVEAAEARFRAVAEHANDAIISLDGAGLVVYLNPHAQQLFGVTLTSQLGRPMEELLVAPFRARWTDVRIRVVAGEEPEGPVQMAGLGHDGEEVPLEISLARWHTHEGTFLTAIARDATERRRAEAKLEYQSLHDPLTGLPNRVLLRDRLQNALNGSGRDESRVAFMLLDLDYFKDVNDTFGHDWGDRVLEGTANRLRAIVRDSDTVARLGGDEFGIVLGNLRMVEDAAAVARKILQTLDRPFVVDGQSASVSASIGVVVAPDHGRDVDAVMRRADVAMYAAKGQRHGYALYEPRQDNASAERLTLSADLKEAIEQRLLTLEFQPQVSLSPAAPVEFEGVPRWLHPEHGLIEPDRWMPLAEHSGLVGDLTDWTLEAAVAQAKHWLDQGQEIPIAVPLSARCVHDPTLKRRVHRALTQQDVPARLLKLELAERTVMAHGGRELENLAELSALGVALTIYGFGAGFSSLAQLKQLPISELKIDRSFTRNVLADHRDVAIVRSIVDLGHNLGLSVVAEGVDSAALAEKVALLGCDRAQGYYFGMPMSADLLDAWVATSPWASPDAEPPERERWRPALKLA